ncbi:MAG TPA: hypothetical protein VGO68_21235 [Pyrinomonadaceae bacterium]|nr:hypothetical protein [Pyrinomonadaceae bacterium]
MDLDKFFGFIRKIVPTLVAIGVGWLMFKWHASLSNPDTDWGRLLEHIGNAFWVTGIVILLYEYGAKEKKVHDSLNTLNGLIREEAGENMEKYLDVLFRDHKGDRPDYLNRASCNLRELIKSFLELQHKNLWAKDKYIDFINYLLTDVVLVNANNLVEIASVGDKAFHVPSSEKMADHILAAQMSAMEKDNKYHVISDLSSWQSNQLSEFRKVTQERVGKGVTVRRIFNILHLDRALDRMVTHDDDQSRINDLRKILDEHLKDAQDWGDRAEGEPLYEIRVMGREELKDSSKRRFLEEMNIHDKHFGLFDHADGIVRFTVTRPNLSDMALSADPNRIEDDLSVFNAAWEYCSSSLTEKQVNRIIATVQLLADRRRLSLASFTAQLSPIGESEVRTAPLMASPRATDNKSPGDSN